MLIRKLTRILKLGITWGSGGRIHIVSVPSWRKSGLQGLSKRCEEEKQFLFIHGTEPHSLGCSANNANKANETSDTYPRINNITLHCKLNTLKKRVRKAIIEVS